MTASKGRSMKHTVRGLLVCLPLLLLALCLFVVPSHAQEDPQYRMYASGESFALSELRADGEYELARGSLRALVDQLYTLRQGQTGSCTVQMDALTTEETLTISGGTYRLVGSLRLLGDAMLVVGDGATLTLGDMTLSFGEEGAPSNGYIRIKDAHLVVDGATVRAGARYAVRMDYASSATMTLRAGRIVSQNAYATVHAELGTVRLLGGTVENTVAHAVYSSASLYLSGMPTIRGVGEDILTEGPVWLNSGSVPFGAEARIRYRSLFAYGQAYAVLYGATQGCEERITLFDRDGTQMPLVFMEEASFTDERDFLAVYLPYTVRYMLADEVLAQETLLYGACAVPPTPPAREGYVFDGWYLDKSGTVPFSLSVSADTTVYAVYRLAPPTFSLSSRSFVYDGQVHTLACDRIAHPLLDACVVTYAWEKDGVALSATLPSVSLRDVADSGQYRLRITLTLGADTVSITTPPVTVSIRPYEVAPPVISSAVYTALVQTATVLPSAYYTVTENEGGDVCGDYPVTLSLRDPENTVWAGGDAAPLTLTFSITRAQNAFVTEPTVNDTFAGQVPRVTFATRFGTGYCLFSEAVDGTYTTDVPTEAGTYYVRVAVDESREYTALMSEPIPFLLYEVRPQALRLLRAPNKAAYTAFEEAILSGIEVALVMSDGSEETLTADRLTLRYTDGRDSLRYGDAFIFVGYGELTLPVAVTVARASYDMSGITFPSAERTYNGRMQTLSVSGTLPTGADGIPLTVVYEGGGRDVGSYTVTARFVTDSDQYESPDAMSATLAVTPCPVTVQWGTTSFVYNGTWQTPLAYATDVDGMPLSVTVEGQGRVAADGYTATCTLTDKNYVAQNATVSFSIRKAAYDMSGVYWSEASFVYDGQPHTVTLLGLPVGVEVIGYTDATATHAGTYTAACTLSYDAQNYETPTVAPHTFTVERAAYDMSGVSFPATVRVYNGAVQYPEQVGQLPIGADGSTPTVSFDVGACHVSDGTVTVTAHFVSHSDNYVAPPDVVTTVAVSPCPITVDWGAGDFVYDGQRRSPAATSDVCSITVTGGMVDAGSYTAKAVSDDPDYMVSNATCPFVIRQAENTWLTAPTVPDAFEGYPLAPSAEAMHGAVTFTFFADEALSTPIEPPLTPGTYYAVATASGDANYGELVSEPIRFCIMAVVPYALSVVRTDTPLISLSTLREEDVIVTLTYTDGTSTRLRVADTTVSYEQGNTLHATDTQIRLSYESLQAVCAITVERITVPTPTVAAADYNGAWQYASLSPSQLYTVTANDGGKHVGTYAVTVAVSDPLNYGFENGETTLTLSFSIVPRALTVSVEDVKVYLDRADPAFVWHVSDGDVVAEDDLALVFAVENGTIVARADNPDYAVTFSLGKVEMTGRLSPEGRRMMYVLGLLFLVLLFVVLVMIKECDRRRLCRSVRNTLPLPTVPCERDEPPCPFDTDAPPTEPLTEIPSTDAPPCSEAWRLADDMIGLAEDACEPTPEDAATEGARDGITRAVCAVDAERADDLITDTLAVRLVEKAPMTIETRGRRKVILNVDKLNDAFSSGERVDVNILKDRFLIPYDTGYLKILADGYLDRALEVYADSFSLQAVKMIALTGGHAYRTATVSLPLSKKENKKRKKH